MNVGIIGYGAYIPRYRIAVEEIAKVWGADAKAIASGLKVEEKSVPAIDEDAATIAVEAARNALLRAQINPEDIEAIYVGSESHPYAVKPTATIVAEAIQATPNLMAADLEFACKAGTAGIQIAIGMVSSKLAKYALAIGADTSQGAPGDALEYTAAAGGAAFLIGAENAIAEFEGTESFTTDTPDFWRREGAIYPQHGGRFTGEPAYFRHVISASKTLMLKLKLKPEDIDYFVPHQPNGKFPRAAAKILGFSEKQLLPGLLVGKIGNTYSGASPLGLSAVLDIAKPGERIMVTSYGSGAGSDSFSLVVTDKIKEVQNRAPLTSSYVEDKTNIDYGTYVKYRKKLNLAK
ncbi:MAG: hydroxymethylglutaryl-CoA synthase [archaeon]